MAGDEALWSVALLGNVGGYGGAAEMAGDWHRVLGKDKKQSTWGFCLLWATMTRLVAVDKRRRTVADGGGRRPEWCVVRCRPVAWAEKPGRGERETREERVEHVCVCVVEEEG